MNSFKKALLSTFLVLLCVLIVSAGILVYTDIKHIPLSQLTAERLSCAGKIDFLIVGGSHLQKTLLPTMIDEELGCFSYNLSLKGITNPPKAMLAENELSRNPVKTLVLEFTHESMWRSLRVGASDSVIEISRAMDNTAQRIESMLKQMPFQNALFAYSGTMYGAVEGIVTGRDPSKIVLGKDAPKGVQQAREGVDYSLSPSEVSKKYNTVSEFPIKKLNKKQIEAFEKTINDAKAHNCRIIVIVTPVSDGVIWAAKDMEDFRIWSEDFCKKHEIELYDFNLSKQRYELFNDKESYAADQFHMSRSAAPVFTKLFCDTLKKVNAGEDVSNDFYATYEEMRADSPYWQYMN